MSASPTVVAIETAVTDYHYDESKANVALRDQFLASLRPENPPRKGENLMVPLQEFEQKLIAFATAHQLTLSGDSQQEQAESARDQIIGKPTAIEAGGALANSFHLMMNAKIDKKSAIPSGVFVTAVGDDPAGKVFADSMQGFINHPAPQDRTMVVHSIPIDGDRILISNPDLEKPCQNHMSPEQLDAIDFSRTKMVMLGGYMKYTGKYDAFLDKLIEKVEAVSQDPAQRPTIVLTAASQDIADSQTLKDAVAKVTQVAPVVVMANTGEFRRLLGRDSQWRAEHEPKWQADGTKKEGAALEQAKQGDKAYQIDKYLANDDAFRAAFQQYCDGDLPVSFVATNGKKGVRVLDNNGISDFYVPPKPPKGVVNTVGGGDAFAGGYLLGQALGLPQRQKADLGFTAAGQVIGQHEARLPQTKTEDGRSGVTAYLDSNNEMHRKLLANMRRLQERQLAA
ncbi:MAG: PfkB family carbohydrate kinase [Rickettsiales bacterium]|nr:PfkB family carbohydrate kinase [Rickettsiales bacterium]